MSNTCVIGWPIGHSRSPIIHNYWREKHAIPGVYERVAVEPHNLAHFIAGLPQSPYIGCNVTIPHKEPAIAHVDHADEQSRRLGAANTIYIRSGQTHASSTDGEGFLLSLLQQVPEFDVLGKTIIVLGAGGAAKAIIGACLDRGAKAIGVINRSAEKARALRQQFGQPVHVILPDTEERALESCNLLINTTSLGMVGQPPLLFDLAALPHDCVVADIVYVPLVTDFLKAAQARGHRIVPGLGMLLHQAVKGFELWHGVRPEVTAELHDLVAADILAGQGR